MPMAPQVMAVIGYINMDLAMVAARVPDLGESLPAKEYNASPGGKASNAAIAAFRSIHNRVDHDHGDSRFESPYDDVEIEIRIIGAVGQDEYGTRAIENLRSNGVNVSGVRISDTVPTGICFITIEDRSRDIRALFWTGATSTLTRNDFATAESLGNGLRPDLIVSQLEMGRSTVEHIMKLAHEERIDLMLNAAPAQVLLMDHYRYITHLVVNEMEAATLLGRYVSEVTESTWAELANEFLEMGVQNVVITLGAQGAYFANHRDSGHVPAEVVRVVDAAGAGDTFVGVYATEYLRQKARNEWSIRDAVARANRAAAHTVCQMGAQEAIPWAYTIDSELEPLSQSTSQLEVGVVNSEHE